MRGCWGMRLGNLVLAGLICGGVAMAIAQDAAIEKRTSTMKQNGAQLKVLSLVAKGEQPFSPGTVKAAEGVVAISKQVSDLFKGGAPGKGSAAKPEIWSDWAGFEHEAKDFAEVAPQLVTAAQSNDAKQLGAALGVVGKECGDCHKAFRAEKKQE